MTQQATLSQDEQIAVLTRRITQLENVNEERKKRVRIVAPAATFLGFLMSVLYVGVFIASITLPNVSGHLSSLLQSIMFSSCIASGTFVLISLVARGETAPQEKNNVAAVGASE